jgi:hypothetical protein
MRGRGYFPQECAPEIELALVAGLWHEPFRLAPTLRWLDLDAHLSQPYLRLVTHALARCYSELGAADFATVVTCLRQLGQLDECGGVQSLDAIYEARWYAPLFDLYGQFLRSTALRRQGELQALPPFFSGGIGRLTLNKVGQSPHYIGSARIAGHSYRISGWGKDENIDLKFYTS